jgi:NAD(P)-dependent dehydrogenase (short-subunit alcohol dehydrogenase family)
VRLCRAILPQCCAGQRRHHHIASEAGVKPLPQMVHYSVSKTAMIGLTRGCAELTKAAPCASIPCSRSDLDGRGGALLRRPRRLGRPAARRRSSRIIFSNEEPTSLIQRFVQPHEVAQLIVFISANQAMNGGAYRVEGGIIRSIL